MENIVRLKGKNIDLCTFRTDEEALIKYTKWVNDEEFNQWIGKASMVVSLDEEKRWAENFSSNNKYRFDIVTKDGVLIGNCEIGQIGINNCGLGILIGEKEYQSKGFGTEVIGMLLKFAFEGLAVHRVELSLMEENIRAKRCYERNGFKVCGCKHESQFYNGEYKNALIMEILDREYKERKEK